jgi:hypothetical protein
MLQDTSATHSLSRVLTNRSTRHHLYLPYESEYIYTQHCHPTTLDPTTCSASNMACYLLTIASTTQLPLLDGCWPDRLTGRPATSWGTGFNFRVSVSLVDVARRQYVQAARRCNRAEHHARRIVVSVAAHLLSLGSIDRSHPSDPPVTLIAARALGSNAGIQGVTR